MNYPKILIILGEPFNQATATGVTLCHLFADYPKEKMSLIYCAKQENDHDFCPNVWKLSGRGFFFCPSANRMPEKAISCRATGMGVRIAADTESKIKSVAREYLSLIPLKLSAELSAWIADFSPDLIYTLGNGSRLMRMASAISDRFGIPIVPHFMDDWPKNSLAKTLPGKMLLKYELRRMLARSPLCLTISPEMSKEYSRRYQKKCMDFMNCIDDALWSPLPDNQETLNIVYIGGLHLNRWKMLRRAGEVIGADRNLRDRYRLTVHVPEADWKHFQAELERGGVVYGGQLSNSEVLKRLTAADVLLHVEADDNALRKFTGLSISTKLPEYFMCGRPVIGFGPQEVASMCEVRRAGGLTAEDAEELKTILMGLLNYEKRNECGLSCRKYASGKHESHLVRKKLYETLAGLINYDGEHKCPKSV